MSLPKAGFPKFLLVTIWAAACTAPYAAAGAQTQSPFTGDDRMAAKRTVRSISASIEDLLADLTRQSGVAFFADEAVQEEPVTVIAHDRPLSETLNALSSLAGLEWTRKGSGNSASYIVHLSDAEKKEQEAARTRRLATSEDRIHRENEEFFRLSDLSEMQRQDLASELPTKLAAETDPAKTEQLRMSYAVLMELNDPSGRHHWAPPVRALLRKLELADVHAILGCETVYYSWPRLPGCREFPPDILERMQEVGRADFGVTSGFRGQVIAFRLRFVGVSSRQPYIRWNLNVGERASQFQSTFGFAGQVPSVWAVSAIPPVPADKASTVDWTGDPALSATATINVGDGMGATKNRSTVHRLGEALDLLDRAHPIDIVADGFWSGNLPGFDAANVPVGDILDRLSRLTGRNWRRDGAFLVMRSRDYYVDREAEPPATQMRRWADAAERGFFTLEDFAEIAALPDPQLTTLQEMAMREEFPVLYSPLHNGRAHLQLWAILSAAERKKAQTEGLAYKDVGPAARLRFLLAETDPAARQLSSTPANEEMIAGSRLRVTTQESQHWKVRGRPGVSTWSVPRIDADNQAVSREEALRRFKQLDESIKLEDVQPATKSSASFSYESDKGAIAMSWVEMPARWTGSSVRSGTR